MFKQGWLALCIALLFASSSFADLIVESYFVDDPFFNGDLLASPDGTGPGDQYSEDNFFGSNPNFSGSVFVGNPLSLPPGAGDVLLTAQMTGTLTEVNFDLGSNLADSTLNDSSLVGTSITLDGILFDPDASSFGFILSATLLDGTIITDLNDLSITSTNSTLSSVNLDGGSFQVGLTPTGGEGKLVFQSATGSHLRSISFSQIQPDVANDVLAFSGNRTISFTPVPEPTAAIVVLGTFAALLLKRRRRVA